MGFYGRRRYRGNALQRKRWYYVKDADTGDLLLEVRGETSACAIEPAQKLAEERGAPVLLQNEDGRNLGRYHPDGQHEYLGY